MKKHLLVVGIIFLFFISTVTPMSTGIIENSMDKWYIYNIDTGGFDYYSSLALDSNDYPHIIGSNDKGHFIQYARWNGSEWEYFDKISEYIAYPHSNSLVLDSEDKPHICYYAVQYGYCWLKYATLKGTVWNLTDIDYGGPGFAIYNSIDIDFQDNPHIAYTSDYYSGQIKYAKFDGYNWEKEKVDDTPNSIGGRVDFTFDSNYYPHIVYNEIIDENNRILRYARWNGSGWEKEIVNDSANNIGAYLSLALDSFDNPHISYGHRLENSSWWYGNIRYAYREGQTWAIEEVTTGDTVGWGTSIVLDSYGNPYITYIVGYRSSGVLMYASRVDGNWESKIIALGGPSYPSFVLDLNDEPHISFCDYISGNLCYATTVKLNCSPDRPCKPSGPISCKIGEGYKYTTSTIDPDGLDS